MKRRQQSEGQLQHAVLDHLRWRGVRGLFYAHIPNGGLRPKATGAFLRGLGTVAGMPDLLLIHSGKVFFLELKTSAGRLSAAQQLTHEALQHAGALCATAHGIDAALAQLEAWGLLRTSAATQSQKMLNQFAELLGAHRRPRSESASHWTAEHRTDEK